MLPYESPVMPGSPSSTSPPSSPSIPIPTPESLDDHHSRPGPAADPVSDPRWDSPRSTVVTPAIGAPRTAPGPAIASTAPLTGSTSAAASSPRTGGSADDDIEMEPIAIQHRRRKSSLMNPAGPSSAGPSRQTTNASSKLVEETGPAGQGSGSGDAVLADDSFGRDSFSDEDLHDDEETGLTHNDRTRRQKKRRKNTRLDQRVAREKKNPGDQQKDADRDIVRRLAINGGLIILWYIFSLSISLYNKWMFDQNRLNFAFPLFTTSLHMVVQFCLAGLVLYLVPSLRPPQMHNSDLGSSRHETEPNSIGMTKLFYLTRIGPCGAATGLDIGLGNMSLKVISLTFYTMCKSSSLAFVLIFAFVFRLETPTWRLVTVIATMTLGVILMVFGEVEFKLGGFILVILAAFFSGFRWALTQILLLRNPATSNPFSSIFYLTPVMFLTLIVLAIPVEGFGPLAEGLKTLSNEFGVFMTPLFLLFPGCIAFLMTAAEFALLQRTSVVTLSIAGIFKEVVTISAASVVFQDRLTVINFVGLLTTMAAIGAYNYIKISKMRQEARADHVSSESTSPSSNSDSDGDDDSAEETAGLLHQSVDLSESLVTSDGDIQTNLMPPPTQTADQHREHKVGRGE